MPGELYMIVRVGCSTLGMPCAGCKIHLMAPLRSTYRGESLVSSEWYCECCDLTFSTTSRVGSEAKLASPGDPVAAKIATKTAAA